ncbi:hypothetical protein SAPIO_CDS10309 [Scedosporium apiospermum]|uniref:Mitochondrial DNA replication protein YHM2 n=1 Tax=Pseudallescheria apiosperma TaxID=563466 RepID=A0A084FV47_PSEDA|nr:uncharacterized protein SAPIO_CDS10309 [Scedosporium apiospermum]KEZ38959.1 hypothetical protein SAPIO_CDS10309 [Scedosporium apiospermum]
MATLAPRQCSTPLNPTITKRKTPWSNLLVGAFMGVFQVSTLGQPMEVVKTHVAANRSDTLRDALTKTAARGGWRGFYQGLIPWAWVEASTKGAILILSSSEVEYYSRAHWGISKPAAGVLGGIAGGAAQAYLSMGEKVPGTLATFTNIVRTKGIRGVYKGVNAVALRQITGWSSRIGISRLADGWIRKLVDKPEDQKLTASEKILASTVGGALSCWNQPFEVLRVEMQSLKVDPARPASPTMWSAFKHIYHTSGPLGFFRGVVPRLGVAVWSTICMVGLGDMLKEEVTRRTTLTM